MGSPHPYPPLVLVLGTTELSAAPRYQSALIRCLSAFPPQEKLLHREAFPPQLLCSTIGQSRHRSPWPLGHTAGPWSTFSQLLVNPWSTFGQPLANQDTIVLLGLHGPLLAHGQSSVNHWSAVGRCQHGAGSRLQDGTDRVPVSQPRGSPQHGARGVLVSQLPNCPPS